MSEKKKKREATWTNSPPFCVRIIHVHHVVYDATIIIYGKIRWSNSKIMSDTVIDTMMTDWFDRSPSKCPWLSL